MRKLSGYIYLVILAAPAVFLIGFVFFGALTTLLLQSFQTYTPGEIVQTPYIPTLQNYLVYVLNPKYFGYVWETLRLAGLSAAFGVILGYPVAFSIVRSGSTFIRKALLVLIIFSFFANPVATTFGWFATMEPAGLFNSFLHLIGQPPFNFLGTDFAVILGLTYGNTVFATLVMIGPLQNIDSALEEAAHSLGAGRLRTLLSVTLPLSIPGIIAASVLTLSLSISAFLVPEILGGGRITFLSNLIFDRFQTSFDFPAGAAQAIELTAIGLVLVFALTKVLGSLAKGYRSS